MSKLPLLQDIPEKNNFISLKPPISRKILPISRRNQSARDQSLKSSTVRSSQGAESIEYVNIAINHNNQPFVQNIRKKNIDLDSDIVNLQESDRKPPTQIMQKRLGQQRGQWLSTQQSSKLLNSSQKPPSSSRPTSLPRNNANFIKKPPMRDMKNYQMQSMDVAKNDVSQMLQNISSSQMGSFLSGRNSKTPSSHNRRIFSGKQKSVRPPRSRQCMDVFDEAYQIIKLKQDPQVQAEIQNNFKVTFGQDFFTEIPKEKQLSPPKRQEKSPKRQEKSPKRQKQPKKEKAQPQNSIPSNNPLLDYKYFTQNKDIEKVSRKINLLEIEEKENIDFMIVSPPQMNKYEKLRSAKQSQSVLINKLRKSLRLSESHPPPPLSRVSQLRNSTVSGNFVNNSNVASPKSIASKNIQVDLSIHQKATEKVYKQDPLKKKRTRFLARNNPPKTSKNNNNCFFFSGDLSKKITSVNQDLKLQQQILELLKGSKNTQNQEKSMRLIESMNPRKRY